MALLKKTCRLCKIERPIEKFPKLKISPDGYDYRCKVCLAVPPRTIKPKDRAKRRCLRCSRLFDSKSKENRICLLCRQSAERILGYGDD